MAPRLDAPRHDVSRNLRLIPIHQGLTGALVWIPIMVLFTRARFDLDGAVRLGAFYYLFVVALEVPSGWLSDRWGRVLTLRLAAASWIVAHACFLLGGDVFAVVALGQFFMAMGFASLSGTDVTLHFDTLEAVGRAGEYPDRQARLSALGYTVTAASAVLGGLLGLVDLRLAFLASLLLAVAQLVVASALVEPGHRAGAAGSALGTQLVQCARYLRDRYLGWIFFYGIAMVTLEHVAVTVLQPWLTEALGHQADDLGATPVVSGLVFAVFSVVGAVAARVSSPLAARFGTVPTLIGFAALSAVIVTGMALWVSIAVLVLVAFRSAQGAAGPVLITAAVAPRVERHHRATLLSMNSLAGRLGYGAFLLLVAGAVEDDVQRVLRIFSFAAWALVVVLIATAAALRRTGRRATIPEGTAG